MIEVRLSDDDPIVSQGAIPSVRPFAAARQPAAMAAIVRPAALVPAAAAAASAPKSPAREATRSAFRSVVRPAAQANKRRIEQAYDDDFSLGSSHPMTTLPRSSRVTVPPPPTTTTTASRPSASKPPSSKPAAKRRKMTTTRWRNPGPHVPFIPRTSPVSDFELDEPPPRSAGAAAPPPQVLSPNEPAADALPAQQQMVDELDDELEGLSSALPAPTAVPPAPLLPPVHRHKPAAASSAAAAMPSVTSNTAQPQLQRQIPLQQSRIPPAAAAPQPASANPSKKRASRPTRTPSPEPSSDDTDDEEVADPPLPQRPVRQIRAQELVTRAHQSNLKKCKTAEHRVLKRAASPRAPPSPPSPLKPMIPVHRSATPDLVPPPTRRRRRTLIRPFREDSEDEDITEVEPPQRKNSPVPSNVPVLPPIQTGGGAAAIARPADAAGASAVAKPVAAPAAVPPTAAAASSARPRKPISAAKPNSTSMSESAGLLPSQLSACTISSYRADAARDLAPPVRGRPGAASDMDTLLADNAYLPPTEWSDRAAPVPARTLEDLDDIDCCDLEEEEQPFRSSMTIDAYSELATCAQNEDITAALQQCSDGHEEIDEEGNTRNSRYLQITEEANMFSLDEAQQFLTMHQRDGSNELLYTTKCWSPTRGLAFDRVKARVALSTKRVVEFVGGELMTRKRHLELNHAHSDDCLSISAQWLTSIGYDGPDLVICSHTHKNRSSLIRFPADAIARTQRGVATESTKPQAERQTSKGRGKEKSTAAAAAAAAERPKPVQANINACVKPCVVVDRKKGVLYAVLVCTRRIFKNHELLMVRDLNRWSSDSHRTLTYSSRRCHWLHARVSQGEEVLLRYVMDRMGNAKEALLKGQAAKEFLETARTKITAIAKQVAAQGAAKSATAAKDANLLPLRPVIELLLRNDVMPDGAKAHQMLRGFDVPFSIERPKVPFVPVHPSVAFEHADCYHIKRSQLLHEEKRALERHMQSLPDCLPSHISADHDRHEYTVDERHLKWIIEHGADWSLIEICEIVDLSNPVRLFTVPSQPAFGVRAKVHIPLGMLLFTYDSHTHRAASDHSPHRHFTRTYAQTLTAAPPRSDAAPHHCSHVHCDSLQPS